MARPSSTDRRLARALHGLRQRRGLSQERVAHLADLTASAYARIERAEANPTWSTITRIATALDVSLEELGRTVDSIGAGTGEVKSRRVV